MNYLNIVVLPTTGLLTAWLLSKVFSVRFGFVKMGWVQPVYHTENYEGGRRGLIMFTPHARVQYEMLTILASKNTLHPISIDDLKHKVD